MRRAVSRTVIFVALILSLAVSASAQLATQTVVSGITNIIALVQDPLVANTFYIVRQSGTVLVLQNGVVLPIPFVDLTSDVGFGGEQGLLGMALSPDGARAFVNFTNTNGDTVVARFARQAGNPVRADLDSRLDLQWPNGQRVIDQPAGNHNGGHLAFGPDGFLYVGLGDGGGSNDQFENAQDPNSLLGKMLRIDVSVPNSDPKGYRVPPSNPFVGLIPLGEIWDIGLRNPWRYSFDNAALGGTGALVMGDVGQGAREEVDYEPAGRGGRNYGWPIREGFIATPGVDNPPTPLLPLTNPLFDYPRSLGVAVTGGYVYRGSALPAAFRGRYFVADWGAGFVGSVGLSINPGTGEAAFADTIDHTAELGGGALGQISSFAEDLSGELYVIRLDAPGAIYKIVSNGAALPGAPQGFISQVNGSTVALSWSPPASGVPSQYRLEVGSAPGASNLLVTTVPGDTTSISATGVADGLYFVRVRAVNGLGAGASSNELDVRVGCTGAPPAPALSQSVNGSFVSLSWSAVQGVSGYVLEVGSQSGLADIGVLPLGSGTLGLAGSAPPGTYFVRVRGQNACGSSVPSNQAEVVVP